MIVRKVTMLRRIKDHDNPFNDGGEDRLNNLPTRLSLYLPFISDWNQAFIVKMFSSPQPPPYKPEEAAL
jgi:hypothetical protein